MPDPRSPDSIADHYVGAHDRILDLVGGLGEDQALTVVPATPEWSVHDLLAHLVSIPSELASGKLTGIPTPQETQAQVEERRGRGIPALLEEWEQGFAPIIEATRAGLIPAPLAVDAITHEQDLRGALGAPAVPDGAAVSWAALGFSWASGFGSRRRGWPRCGCVTRTPVSTSSPAEPSRRPRSAHRSSSCSGLWPVAAARPRSARSTGRATLRRLIAGPTSRRSVSSAPCGSKISTTPDRRQ